MIVALRKQEPLSAGEGASNFSTISISGPSVAVRGGAQLGLLSTSSMWLFFPGVRSELGSPSVAVRVGFELGVLVTSSMWPFFPGARSEKNARGRAARGAYSDCLDFILLWE